uniref:Uncharacterized protein n=1 Tax=Alexandrium monilatum TaxID=311494 RepID=A0A6T0R426_9DINO
MKSDEPAAAPYDPALRRWMLSVILGQVVVCLLRLWLLWDVWGGFVMALSIALGYYALREDLPSSLVCLWGFVNAYEAAWDTVTGTVSLVMNLVWFRLTECLVIVVIPLADILGTVVAWQLFKDRELRRVGMLTPVVQKNRRGQRVPEGA